MKHEINKKLLLKHIRRSDLLGREKLYLEGLVQRNGWIPCSERLPDKGMSVLICGGGGHRVTAYYDPVREVFRLTETDALYYHRKNVTHWMPLPEPPETKEDEYE